MGGRQGRSYPIATLPLLIRWSGTSEAIRLMDHHSFAFFTLMYLNSKAKSAHSTLKLATSLFTFCRFNERLVLRIDLDSKDVG